MGWYGSWALGELVDAYEIMGSTSVCDKQHTSFPRPPRETRLNVQVLFLRTLVNRQTLDDGPPFKCFSHTRTSHSSRYTNNNDPLYSIIKP
jgi:hypothetical protein